MAEAAKTLGGARASEYNGMIAAREGKPESSCPHQASDPGSWNQVHRYKWLEGYRAEKARQQ